MSRERVCARTTGQNTLQLKILLDAEPVIDTFTIVNADYWHYCKCWWHYQNLLRSCDATECCILSKTAHDLQCLCGISASSYGSVTFRFPHTLPRTRNILSSHCLQPAQPTCETISLCRITQLDSKFYRGMDAWKEHCESPITGLYWRVMVQQQMYNKRKVAFEWYIFF